MAALHFLKQMKYNVKAFFINHNTETSLKAHAFLMEALKGDFYADQIPMDKPKDESWEEHWRNGRYSILNSHLNEGCEVITAHNLNDAVETWVHSSLHGQSKIIPYRHGSVIRPFLATPKKELIQWAVNHDVKWIDDLSNNDTKYQRNFIRHILMPQILKVNPGIASTIRKKILTRGVK